MYRQNKNKKALSNLIAYVLLISITLALSVFVYNWLRFYVSEEEVATCPEGVNVIITDYSCFAGDRLIYSLKNKGRFSVDGFIARVHNRTDAEFGFYTLNETGVPLAPGEEFSGVLQLSPGFDKITLLEIQPFMKEGENISCKSLATQRIPSSSC